MPETTCDACGEPGGEPGMVLHSNIDGEYRKPGHACVDCQVDHPRLWRPMTDATRTGWVSATLSTDEMPKTVPPLARGDTLDDKVSDLQDLLAQARACLGVGIAFRDPVATARARRMLAQVSGLAATLATGEA